MIVIDQPRASCFDATKHGSINSQTSGLRDTAPDAESELSRMNASTFLAKIAVCIAALSGGAALAVPVARCPFDNELVSAQREGMMYARYALNIRGAPLVAATGFTPEHAAAAQALMECPSCWPQLDMNGSGAFDATDALIIARHIAGFRGAALTAGVTLTGSRNTKIGRAHV